jgi:hypothetical protein
LLTDFNLSCGHFVYRRSADQVLYLNLEMTEHDLERLTAQIVDAYTNNPLNALLAPDELRDISRIIYEALQSCASTVSAAVEEVPADTWYFGGGSGESGRLRPTTMQSHDLRRVCLSRLGLAAETSPRFRTGRRPLRGATRGSAPVAADR